MSASRPIVELSALQNVSWIGSKPTYAALLQRVAPVSGEGRLSGKGCRLWRRRHGNSLTTALIKNGLHSKCQKFWRNVMSANALANASVLVSTGY